MRDVFLGDSVLAWKDQAIMHMANRFHGGKQIVFRFETAFPRNSLMRFFVGRPLTNTEG